uniref:laminin subunit alpha-3 n=1 Tax=Semicossyphus pulcher TaxID=241346 RepID=UPI0037E6FAA4
MTVQHRVFKQKCSSGSYRETVGPRRGQCVPCSCNGLSEECDEKTGNCVNCRSNTRGHRCERCEEGHYGDAASRTCRACPCPFTWNNFALACLDVGSGSVECLCKRGFSGGRCERCSFGYFGNPTASGGGCKPCNCKEGSVNVCDPLSGECSTPGDSGCGDHCQERKGCSVPLLLHLETMDDVLALMKKQLQNVSDSKTLVGRLSSAVRHLDVKVEQLEADVDFVGEDFSQLIKKMHKTVSDVEKVSQHVNGTKLKAEDRLSEAEALLRAIQDLMNQQLSEVKPAESDAPSEEERAVRMEEAQRRLQDVRGRSCTAPRGRADREREEANTLLDVIRSNMTRPAAVLHHAADSLMASLSSLREVAELLSDAEDGVSGTNGLNLKSYTELQHLEEYETHGAQLDGAKLQLFKKLNKIFQKMGKLETVTRAEEHAEELCREAAEIRPVLHNATHSSDLLRVRHGGAYNSFITAVEKAEKAANRCRASADHALQDVKDGGLIHRAAGLTDNSTHLWRDANMTQSDRNKLSLTVNGHQHKVHKQRERAESLRTRVSTISDDLRRITRDDTADLTESVNTAASASNSSVSHIADRLRSIRQEVDRITVTNVGVDTDDVLTDADRALEKLNSALPVLTRKITEVEALSETAPPGGNMTGSIRRIKELMDETRTFVKRLSIATTFSGKTHVELHPPRNVEDLKAFTAVDLLLSLHPNKPSKRRRRRQDKHRDFFVFYLGSRNASGDYIGMTIRNKVLVCVYKLGGVVHEVETSQITATNERVYQDAEVNITQNFTSQKPVSVSPKRLRPNTMSGVLQLDPDGVVFYVGGYPEDFTPPVELHYPKFRGAMKLSYINDHPVCLFSYKHAVNLDVQRPAVKIPQSEVSDYYEGTGYRLALIAVPDKIKRRLFRFHTNSRETNAFIFYIGNEDSFFCLFVERGFLVLQGRQAGRELRAQSAEHVSLSDKSFAITIGDTFTVHVGPQRISSDHIQTNYRSYYIGGLPARLRQRHNITAPPLRGCVDRLTEDGQIVEYNTTVGVSEGCPVSLLGVRAATLSSAPSADSLFVWDEQPLAVSLGFRTKHTHGSLLRSSSQGSSSVHDLQLSLADGFAVFSCDNYTLRSDQKYSDGRWHYLSAVRRKTGLQLSIDNMKVIQGQTRRIRHEDQTVLDGCIANLYTRRADQSFLPADLSSLSLTGDVVLGPCDLHPPPHAELLPEPVTKKPQKHKPIQAPAGIKCRPWSARRAEYQLLEEHSWLSYTLPPDDLNHRPHFSLEIKTKSSKGVILHVAGRGVIPLLALFIANGKIKMSLGHDRIIHHKQKSNDGDWHRVEFSVERSSFHLLVDGVRVTDGHLPDSEGSSLDLMNPVSLGGEPTGRATKGHNIPMNSVIGCVRGFKMNDEAVGEPEGRYKTLPCSDRLTETGTYFSGGHIVKDDFFPLSAEFVLSFELRPQYLTVSRQQEVINLEVDSTSEQRDVSFLSTSSSTPGTLYIGGTSATLTPAVSSPFVGCLRDVKLNGRRVSFEAGSRDVQPVSVTGCPAA